MGPRRRGSVVGQRCTKPRRQSALLLRNAGRVQDNLLEAAQHPDACAHAHTHTHTMTTHDGRATSPPH
eukprot:2767538-Lingulodinium_polyedra.AAC.1